MVSNIFTNEYISVILKVLLLLYASQIAPKAPIYLTSLFNNVYVKIIMVSLIVYMVKYDFQFSLIFAIILVLGMNVASGRKIMESYGNVNSDSYGVYSKDYKPYGNFTLLEPKNEIFPGCVNVKYIDLLNMFTNDNYKLQTAVQNAFYQLLNDNSYTSVDAKTRLMKTAYMAGLPYNLEINDDNAPWIATLLLNYGFIISDTCQQPGY